MRLTGMSLLVVSLAISLSSAAAQELQAKNDPRSLINRLKGQTFFELTREFSKFKTPVYDKSYRNLIIDTKIRQRELKVISDQEVARKVRERIRPVLKLYGRENIDIIVFDSPAPDAVCVSGTALFYSTGLLEMAHRDRELEAITAHELAHEYLNALAVRAFEKNDYDTIRQIELVCDAFAVAALHELRLKASTYSGILQKLMQSPYAVAWKGDGTDSHPPLAVRVEAIGVLARALRR